MLKENKERIPVAPSRGLSPRSAEASQESPSRAGQGRLEKVLRIEWLGQTVASLCWIVSVLTYGISSSGDWLQLFAASSWLLANIAAVMPATAK